MLGRRKSAQALPPTIGYGQCGGNGATYNPICVTGFTCVYSNAYYSQCLPCGPGQQIPVCPTLTTGIRLNILYSTAKSKELNFCQ